MEPSDGGSGGSPVSEIPSVWALRASSDRTVFTEDGNEDGWIATDLVVELRQ